MLLIFSSLSTELLEIRQDRQTSSSWNRCRDLECAPWSRSTARRSGPTGRASRGAVLPALRPPERARGRAAHSVSSRAARRCSSRPGPGRLPRSYSACWSPGQTIALAEGAYYGTAVLFRSLERWGLRFVEFDQTGPPPDGADLIWLGGAVEPVPDHARPRGGRGPPRPRRRRLDRGHPRLPAAARARRGLCPPQRDQVPRRPPRRAAGCGRMPLARGRGGAA